jgi:hypothetical protein
VEHHLFPREHWTRLPARRCVGRSESGLPPVVRFLERGLLHAARARRRALRFGNTAQAYLLCLLERLALCSPRLRRWLVSVHTRAFATLLPQLGSVSTAAIVGGGLFPRSALVLRQLLPHCRLVLIDENPQHLAQAYALLVEGGQPCDVELRLAHVANAAALPFDLVVVPLAFVGDRAALRTASAQHRTGSAQLLVHDWLHNRYGTASTRVSWLLFKRLNLVRQ